MVRLAQKFAEQYRLGMTRHQRSYQRGQNQPVCVLLIRYNPKEACFTWILLSTQSSPFEAYAEPYGKLTERSERLVLGNYELTRHTPQVPGKPELSSNRVRWTWALSRESFEQLRVRISLALKLNQVDRVAQILRYIQKEPGFAGIRQQVRTLKKIVQRHNKRQAYPAVDALPAKSKMALSPLAKSFYIARAKSQTVRLSYLLKKLEAQGQIVKDEEHRAQTKGSLGQSNRADEIQAQSADEASAQEKRLPEEPLWGNIAADESEFDDPPWFE